MLGKRCSIAHALLIASISGVLGCSSASNQSSESSTTLDPGELEALANVKVLNQDQQEFYAENGRFAKTREELKSDVPRRTESYKYSMYSGADQFVSTGASPREEGLLMFTGFVNMNPATKKAEEFICAVDVSHGLTSGGDEKTTAKGADGEKRFTNVYFEGQAEEQRENCDTYISGINQNWEDSRSGNGQYEKARQSEGQTYTGTMNRAQQAFYIENGRFATSLDELKAGIPTESESYSYSTTVVNGEAISVAEAKNKEIRSFKGIVRIESTGRAQSLLCTTSGPGMRASAADRSASNFKEACE